MDITFQGTIYKLETRPDGGTRLQIDIPECHNDIAAELVHSRNGKVFQVALIPIPDKLASWDPEL